MKREELWGNDEIRNEYIENGVAIGRLTYFTYEKAENTLTNKVKIRHIGANGVVISMYPFRNEDIHYYVPFDKIESFSPTYDKNDDIGVYSFLELRFNLRQVTTEKAKLDVVQFIYNICSDLLEKIERGESRAQFSYSILGLDLDDVLEENIQMAKDNFEYIGNYVAGMSKKVIRELVLAEENIKKDTRLSEGHKAVIVSNLLEVDPFASVITLVIKTSFAIGILSGDKDDSMLEDMGLGHMKEGVV